MKNFIFKSSDPDLQKMFSSLEIIQKNILYTTHRVDAILNRVNQLVVDKDLQKQATEYFQDNEDTSHPEDEADLD